MTALVAGKSNVQKAALMFTLHFVCVYERQKALGGVHASSCGASCRHTQMVAALPEAENIDYAGNISFVQVLIFRLTQLLPATHGRMDTEAGERMQVCHLLAMPCHTPYLL